MHIIDSHGTLTAQSLSKAHRKPFRGVACGVLVAIGIALCIMPYAGSSESVQQKEYVDYKTYSLYLLDFNYKEYKCLTILYGKESASQVRLRAERIKAIDPQLFLASETDLGAVIAHIDAVKFQVKLINF